MSDTEYDPSGNSKCLFHVGADIFNFSFSISSTYFSSTKKNKKGWNKVF